MYKHFFFTAEAISYKKIQISTEQMKKIQSDYGGAPSENTRNTVAADISLDNLMTSKRTSKTVTPIKSTPRRTKKGGSAVETSVHSEEENIMPSSAVKNRKKSTNRRKTKDQEPPNTSTTEDDTATAAVKETTRKRGRPKKSSNPMIFKGMVFILTQGKNVPTEENSQNESAMEDEIVEENDDDGNEMKTLEFNKKHVRKLLTEYGGKVLDKFPGDKDKISPKVILISDRYCKTMTYLLAIAYG